LSPCLTSMASRNALSFLKGISVFFRRAIIP
jgi:hypothetical protein